MDARPLSGWAQRIGYVFQNPKDQLFQETVYKEIEFGFRHTIRDDRARREKIEQIAELTGLQDCLTVHPLEMAYSRQKLITLASVLSTDPELILLDEPTAGQDWSEIELFESVLSHLAKTGKTFLTISHDMNFVARNFTRVLVFCAGEVLIDGTPEEVFGQPELIRKSFVESPVPVLVSKDLGMKGCPLTVEGVPPRVRGYKNVVTQKTRALFHCARVTHAGYAPRYMQNRSLMIYRLDVNVMRIPRR